MAGKNTAAFGIYANRGMAENAVDRLIAQGFRNEDISVMLQDNVETKDFAHEKNTKAPEGTATGCCRCYRRRHVRAVAGIGALAIPGLGPFIAAGPIMATLAGIGSGGLVGGLVGALVWHGHTRVRSEALRRSNQRRRRSSLGPLRQQRVGWKSEKSAKGDRSRGCLFHRRGFGRFR